MKKWLFFILLVLICFIFTGCWNYREIESLSIAAGTAIERDPENGGYILYTEIVETSGGTKQQALESKIVESRGQTIFDAVRNATNVSGKRLFENHAQTIIVSEDIARQGILDVIDWFYRDSEPRLTLNLLVAKGASAKDIISLKGITNQIHSFEINDQLENTEAAEEYPEVELYQIVETLKSEIPYAYVPCITIENQNGKEVSSICGTAVFKGDKLAGFLDGEDTKYFLFAIDKINGGLLVNKNVQDNPDANISLEIFNNKTTVKPVYQDGKLTMTIDIKTEAAIGESGPYMNLENKSGLTAVKEDMQEFLVQNIVRVIQKVQNEFDTDIFGFGQTVYQEMPDVWEKYKNNWDTEFNNLTFQVSSEIKIRNTAQTDKSLEGAK